MELRNGTVAGLAGHCVDMRPRKKLTRPNLSVHRLESTTGLSPQIPHDRGPFVSTMTIAATPVFVDATGRRVKAARVAVRGITALLLILVAVTAMSLIGGLPLPGFTRRVTVPIDGTSRPPQEVTNLDVSVAGGRRADVPPSAQTRVEPDVPAPPTSARPDPAMVISASVPQTLAPWPTQAPRSASSVTSAPVSATATSTPAPTPNTPTARPTPTNRPVQPPGQSGSHGPGAQHGPPPGHGPPAGHGPPR
jgi:hypothetical protein